MLSRLSRRASVGVRLALLSCVFVAAIFAAFTWAITQSAATQVGEQVRMRIAEKDQSVASSISLIDGALTAEVDRAMQLFESFLPGAFTLDPTQTVDIGGKATPVFKSGDHVLNLDFSVPDQFLARSGEIATIFARSGDDFVRVTTSLKKQDGSRAIGTLLDRKGPAYAPVLANRTYTGLAQLFGKQYITQYKPILDASGHVIGALFVGVDVGEQIEALKSEIAKLKIGETGYYFVMDASNGPGRGTFLVHPSAAGKHYDDADAPWSRMLEAREGTLDYTSADTRARFASFVSVPQWQWLVGGVAVRDEIMAEVNATRDRFAAIGLALVVLFAALSIYAARRIVSQPLDAAAQAAGQLAAGDLTVRIGNTGGNTSGNTGATHAAGAQSTAAADEIGRLTRAIDGIGVGLAQIVAQVRSATAQMSEDTSRIAQGSGEIASRIASQASSLEETAASMERTHLHRAAERRPRVARQQRGEQRGRSRARRRPRRGPRGGDDERHQPLIAKDRRDYRRDRRHRVPDQYPRAQRRCGSRARRRARQGLRRGGERSARARATQRGRGEGNLGADRRIVVDRRDGLPHRRRGEHDDARHRRARG